MPKDNQWQVKGVIYYTFVYLRFLLRYLQVVSIQQQVMKSL